MFLIADLCREPIKERVIIRGALRVKRPSLERLMAGDSVTSDAELNQVVINDPFLCVINLEIIVQVHYERVKQQSKTKAENCAGGCYNPADKRNQFVTTTLTARTSTTETTQTINGGGTDRTQTATITN